MILTNETFSGLFRDHELFLGEIRISESFDVIVRPWCRILSLLKFNGGFMANRVSIFIFFNDISCCRCFRAYRVVVNLVLVSWCLFSKPTAVINEFSFLCFGHWPIFHFIFRYFIGAGSWQL